MIYAILGFCFGALIPYMARRFSKFMPATPAYALFRLVWPVKHVSRQKSGGNLVYQRLLRRYRMRSLGLGIVTAALSVLASWHFSAAGWVMVYIWLLLLLMEIDRRMLLLPDILTIPLMLCGLCFSMFSGSWVMLPESVLGAVLGYVLPIAASAFLVWRYKDAFGGGDIKLLMALGAWLGAEHIGYVIVGACLLFALEAALLKKKSGAFGPALAVSAIIVAFVCF